MGRYRSHHARRILLILLPIAIYGVVARRVAQRPLHAILYSEQAVVMQFAPDNQTLYTAGYDGPESSVKYVGHVCDVSHLQVLNSFKPESVPGEDISPRAGLLARVGPDTAGGIESYVDLLDAASHLLRSTVPIACVSSVKFSPRGDFLIAFTKAYGGVVSLKPIGRWSLFQLLGRTLHGPILEGREQTTAVDISNDSRTLAVGTCDGRVQLWDLTTRHRTSQFLALIQTPSTPTAIDPSRDGVGVVAFSPDGKQLASVTYDGTIRLWRVSTAQELHHFKAHESCVESAVFSSDGTMLALGCANGIVELHHL